MSRSELYPGQKYFHRENADIRATEERWYAKMRHAWDELIRNDDKTDADKALIAAVLIMSVEKYASKTMAEIYDDLLVRYKEVFE